MRLRSWFSLLSVCCILLILNGCAKKPAEATKAAQIHYQRGIDFSNRQDYSNALKEFKEAVRISSGYAEAWVELGICIMETGDFDSALKPLGKAIELNPKLPKAHYAMAVAMARKKNPDTQSARKHCEIAVKLGYKVPDWFLPYLERLEKK